MNLKHENQAKRIESSQYDKRIQVNIDFQLSLKNIETTLLLLFFYLMQDQNNINILLPRRQQFES